MKTSEEIAIKHGLYNSFTKKADESAIQAMKEYALEVAKEALKNASASLIKHYFIDHSDKAIDEKDIEKVINCEDNIPEI